MFQQTRLLHVYLLIVAYVAHAVVHQREEQQQQASALLRREDVGSVVSIADVLTNSTNAGDSNSIGTNGSNSNASSNATNSSSPQIQHSDTSTGYTSTEYAYGAEAEGPGLNSHRARFPTWLDYLWLTPHPGIEYEGRVPQTSEGKARNLYELERAKAEGADCLNEGTVIECMQTKGSYGINRLRSMPFHYIVERGWTRPNWMAHDVVQGSRLLEVSFPMSHASSSYEMYAWDVYENGKGLSATVIRQDYDIYQQLTLGIRAFDLPVAYNTEVQEFYCANRELTVSLPRVLNDIQGFLDSHKKETVILDLRTAQLVQDEMHRPVGSTAEVTDQKIHNLVEMYLGNYLATSTKISKMVVKDDGPMIGDLVSHHARVLYFWNGKQVLCTNPSICGDNTTSSNFEPLCLSSSTMATASNDALLVLNGVINFSKHTQEFVEQHRPACLSPTRAVPPNNAMPLLERVDGHLVYTEEEYEKSAHTFLGTTSLYTRGEALTCRSDAERMNYLLLVWFLATHEQAMFSEMSLISMDFVYPALVHRIVDASQGRGECGYILDCVDSGSCFASDLRSPTSGCLNEWHEFNILANYAERRIIIGRRGRFAFFILSWIVVKALIMHLWCPCCQRRKKEEVGVEDKGAEVEVEESEEAIATEGGGGALQDDKDVEDTQQ